jgi:hypothetical protein
MQKRLIADESSDPAWSARNGLDLEALADVEISSEAPAYPIEAALLHALHQGWRADRPGKQTIRLLFKQPQAVRSLQLRFREDSLCRTQEYVLRVSSDHGESSVEMVRQQWNFSPEHAPEESEEHVLNLPGVTMIELIITPDISGRPAIASLEKMRVY